MRARAALASLLEISADRARLADLRRGVAEAARRVIYSRGAVNDAVDVLVTQSLRPLHIVPTEGELAAYKEQVQRRQRLIDAQVAFERTRAERRRAGGASADRSPSGRGWRRPGRRSQAGWKAARRGPNEK